MRTLFDLTWKPKVALGLLITVHAGLEALGLAMIYKIVASADVTTLETISSNNSDFYNLTHYTWLLITVKLITTCVTYPIVTACPMYLTHAVRGRFISKYMANLSHQSYHSLETISNLLLVEIPRYGTMYFVPRIRLLSETTNAFAALVLTIYVLKDKTFILYSVLVIGPILLIGFITKYVTRNFGIITMALNERLAYFLTIASVGRLELLASKAQKHLHDITLRTNKHIRNEGAKIEILSGLVRPFSELAIFILLVVYIQRATVNSSASLSDLIIVGLLGLKIIPMLSAFSDFLVKKNYVESMRSKYAELSLNGDEGGPSRIPVHITEDDDCIIFNGQVCSERSSVVLENFTIRRGRCTSISGESGGGKTSLLLELFVFSSSFRGQILLLNTRLQSTRTIEISGPYVVHGFSFGIQTPILLTGSVFENVAFCFDNSVKFNRSHIEKLLKDFHLAVDSDRAMNIGGLNLSGGEKSRLNVCRTLYRDAELYVFDEPTTGLDSDAAKYVSLKLVDLLQDKFCIIITHDRAIRESAKDSYWLQSDENGVHKLTRDH